MPPAPLKPAYSGGYKRRYIQMVSKLAETNLSVLVTPSSSVPGQWVAHCLNLNIVTQGDSIQHALMMAREAVGQVVADDLLHGLDPLERPAADPECWKMVAEIHHQGLALTTVQDPSRIRAALASLRVVVPTEALPHHARPEEIEVEMMPPAWQLAALSELRGARHSLC
jgi:hypothetical protein